MSPPAAQPGKKVGARDLLNGGILQCVEAATLGMPFEVRGCPTAKGEGGG